MTQLNYSVIAKKTTSTVIPCGEVILMSLAYDPEQLYYLYVPKKGGDNARIFISIHGISRNAEEHAGGFTKQAELYGVILIAPLFHRKRFPDFQRLGRRGKGSRPDLMLQKIVDEVTRITKAQGKPVFFFGYSGGGQFVHRYAMAYPNHVSRIAIGAAGWYTFPDATQRFPRGIEHDPKLPDIHFKLTEFLSVPVSVLVGQWDDVPDDDLNQSKKINRQQGLSRMERGRRWVDAMRTAARALGLKTSYDFRVLQDSGHSFTQCMEKGKMGSAVFKFLFDSPTQKISVLPDTLMKAYIKMMNFEC
ncbi:MAG: alpha/beta hydrolase [Desulfosarcina sp.]|nr:alpha/beta hydrolase [Desulfobacterales bacterium]